MLSTLLKRYLWCTDGVRVYLEPHMVFKALRQQNEEG